jgi:hypothetical protein
MTAIWEEIYPKTLGNLHQLQEPHLEFNNLLGRILREIGRLTQLQSLSLINNNILWEDFFEPWQLSQIEASLTPSKLLEG